jgi:hypothetical protein
VNETKVEGLRDPAKIMAELSANLAQTLIDNPQEEASRVLPLGYGSITCEIMRARSHIEGFENGLRMRVKHVGVVGTSGFVVQFTYSLNDRDIVRGINGSLAYFSYHRLFR